MSEASLTHFFETYTILSEKSFFASFPRIDSMSAKTTTLESTINVIMRNASLAQVKNFAGLSNPELIEIDDQYTIGQVLSDQMILMAISGEDLRITFKLHYKQGDTIKLLKKEEADINSEDTVNELTDYMKELNNQICGKICRDFAKQKISLGMSIPLRLRGFYEAYSDYTYEPSPLLKFGDFWKVCDEFGAIYVTSYVEISNASRLRMLRSDVSHNNDQGMEFL